MFLVRSVLGALLMLLCASAARAQEACVPNPNASGPPFVNGCPLPASALNNLILPGPIGAAGNGTTDDNIPLQNLFNSGAAIVQIPAKTFRSSLQLTVPDGVTVVGAAYNPGAVPPTGSVIQCDATVSGPCLVVGNNTGKPARVQSLTISRGAGVVPSNGECLQLNGTQEGIVADVECYNHAQGFEVDSNGTTGFYNRFQRILTCKISDAHFIVNTAPGIYLEDSNLGCNGPNDVASNDFVRIVGNWDSTAGTIHISNTQLNQGNGTVVCAFDFKSFTGVTNQILDFAFDGGHVETAQNFLCSDSSVKHIAQSHFSNFWTLGGWGGGNHAINLNSATNLHYFSFNNVIFQAWADATFAPASGVSLQDLRITGSSFISTPLSITAQSGTQSTMSLAGNQYGNLTLGGSWDLGSVSGNNFAGSVVTTTGLANTVVVDLPSFSLRSCTLALSFGGGSSGLTYSANTCKWSQVGSQVTITFNFTLSAVGSSTGAAALAFTGPPPAGPSYGQSSNALTFVNMSGLNGGLWISMNPSVSTANLYTGNTAPIASLVSAANTNFTSTAQVWGSIVYTIGS